MLCQEKSGNPGQNCLFERLVSRLWLSLYAGKIGTKTKTFRQLISKQKESIACEVCKAAEGNFFTVPLIDICQKIFLFCILKQMYFNAFYRF
jgi:hypothetical protein